MFRMNLIEVSPSNTLKECSQKYFFSIDVLYKIDQLQRNILSNQSKLYTLRHLKSGPHSLFFVYMILLSADVNLNPGPTQFKSVSNNVWDPFKSRGMHLLHLNVNSLINKIDEIRYIAKASNASFIGLTETKLDDTIYDSEISIDDYTVIRNDRNRYRGGVACYIKNSICYNNRNIFSNGIENVFIDILLPRTKPFTVGVFYRPPNNNDFLKEISKDFSKLLPETNDIFILGDFNINVLCNNKSILETNKNVLVSNSTTLSAMSKQYIDFCSTFFLKQIIKSPTRVTKSSSTLIDHILTNTNDKISKSGIIDIGLSDHQLIYCTKKNLKVKFYAHKHISCRSYENYNAESFIRELSSLDFPNYENFDDVNVAYSDFSKKLMQAIDKLAPLREIRVKNRSQEWFDKKIHDAILLRDKLLTTFKKSRNNFDEKQYRDSRTFVQNLVNDKKRLFFENKLKQNIGNPKDLWKTLKSLGLPKKTTPSNSICLKVDDKYSFEPKKTLSISKRFIVI